MTKGDKQFSAVVTKPIKTLIDFPDLFKESVKEVKTLPETFVKTPENFTPVNLLEKDLKALITYSNEKNGRTIELRNLKNNESLYKWEVKNPHKPQSRIMDPLLLPHKEIIYSFNGVTGLFKIDSLSNQIWKQTSIAHHHSITQDSTGNIWVCSYNKEKNSFIMYGGKYKVNGRYINYIDNTISKLDATTGEILFHKSFTDILAENNLEHLILKSDNSEDPFHLNDVQPALKTTPYYNEGDVFISSRNLSSIIHYRPKTNEVIEIIEGPFYSQHDIDFLNDSTIAFFNNNSHTKFPKTNSQWKKPKQRIELDEFYSKITCYDLKNKKFFNLGEQAFKDNHIFTRTEGVTEFLPDGRIFVEEQNSGIIWVFKNNKVIYKDVYKSQHTGYHHLPNWTKIINK